MKNCFRDGYPVLELRSAENPIRIEIPAKLRNVQMKGQRLSFQSDNFTCTQAGVLVPIKLLSDTKKLVGGDLRIGTKNVSTSSF